LDGKLRACQRGFYHARIFVLAAITILGMGLTGCTVAEAGGAVIGGAASIVGTAASVTSDVVTSLFDSSDDEKDHRR